MTALVLAAGKGNDGIADALIAAGATLDKPDYVGPAAAAPPYTPARTARRTLHGPPPQRPRRRREPRAKPRTLDRS